MTEQSTSEVPRIEWESGELKITLPMKGGTVNAKWRPQRTAVIRIRESGAEAWSPGFETPLNGFTFVDLHPNTEYEFQVTYKTADGEGPPIQLRHTTRPDGGVDNVVPFPTK